MKCVKTMVICFVLMGAAISVFPSAQQEYIRAKEYLDRKGEVYFSFGVSDYSELERIGQIISIDKVNGAEVFAYASTWQFAEFQKFNYYYEVLPHPGDNPDVEMFGPEEIEDQLRRGMDRFPTYEAYIQMMDKFASDYPQLCKIVEYGQSVNGRKLLAAVLSDNVNEKEKEPQFYYLSTIHGDETTGYGMMLMFIDYLLKNYGKDQRVSKLIDNVEIWITPDANPDGTYKGGNNTVGRAIRENANGYDLNRNFPSPPGFGETVHRPIQKETQAMMDLGDDQRFVLSADFHGGAEVACYPWGYKSDYKTADHAWWQYISKVYADKVGYFSGVSGGQKIINGFQWYKVIGERMNYTLYYQSCRLLTLEVSDTKNINGSQINTYWDRNKEALIRYVEECLYGINGTVTDRATGKGIKAKVFVENHDKENSHVFSNLPHGDFYRPIAAGTYTVTFSADGYDPVTISDVKVENEKATVLDVKMGDSTHIAQNIQKGNAAISIMNVKEGLKIDLGTADAPCVVRIYDVKGNLLTTATKANSFIWNGTNHTGMPVGNGYYIVKVLHNGNTFTKSFIFTK